MNTFWKNIALLYTSLLLTACVREDLPICTPQNYFYLKIINAAAPTNESISSAIEHVEVYLFDGERHFVRSFSLSKKEVQEGALIKVDDFSAEDSLFVSVWGNLSEKEIVSTLTLDSEIDRSVITLATNGDGYTSTPDNLFFGSEIIRPAEEEGQIEEIKVSQKNAYLHITVRGLNHVLSPNDYSIIIEEEYNGYTFSGKPTRERIQMKAKGVFTVKKEFVTPHAICIIHADNMYGEDDNKVTLRLVDANDKVIVETSKDVDGNYIIPQRNMMTNVLFDLTNKDGPAKVYVEVTPWNEYFQWETWQV